MVLNLHLPLVNNIKKSSILLGHQSGQQQTPSLAVATPLLMSAGLETTQLPELADSLCGDVLTEVGFSS